MESSFSLIMEGLGLLVASISCLATIVGVIFAAMPRSNSKNNSIHLSESVSSPSSPPQPTHSHSKQSNAMPGKTVEMVAGTGLILIVNGFYGVVIGAIFQMLPTLILALILMMLLFGALLLMPDKQKTSGNLSMLFITLIGGVIVSAVGASIVSQNYPILDGGNLILASALSGASFIPTVSFILG